MRGINKAIILGRMGADPEIRTTNSGLTIANLRIATNHSKKDASGQYVDQTEWHRVVALGKTAETIQKYVKKGSQLYIEGRIKTQKWQNKEGVDQYTTEIVCNEFQFVGGNNQAPAQPSQQPMQPSQDKLSQQQQAQSKPSFNVDAPNFSDDDIPF